MFGELAAKTVERRAPLVNGACLRSVRTDAYTRASCGEPVESYGWSFVDLRIAPPRFVEWRPDWPWTLTLEGGDEHPAHPAPFAVSLDSHDAVKFVGRTLRSLLGLR
jgi:hypothetical protein